MSSRIRPYFKQVNAILDWNIDTEDVDKILRIEAHESLTEQDVINLMHLKGFYCEPLKD